MNFISWNCRGLENSRTVRCLRDLVKSRNPKFLFLSETIACSDKIKDTSIQLGFSNFFAVDRSGMGGGLAVMWRRHVNCEFVSYSPNYIDVWIVESGRVSWRLTCFYGIPERVRRQQSWDLLRSLALTSQLPMCVFGDFNDMLQAEDKLGLNDHPQALLEGFRSVIDDCLLTEIELEGGKYTWEKSKGKQN